MRRSALIFSCLLLRATFLLRARLLFAEGGISIAHLRLPRVVLRAVSQLGLERLHHIQRQTHKKKRTSGTQRGKPATLPPKTKARTRATLKKAGGTKQKKEGLRAESVQQQSHPTKNKKLRLETTAKKRRHELVEVLRRDVYTYTVISMKL